MTTQFHTPTDEPWAEQPRGFLSRSSIRLGWLVLLFWLVGITGFVIGHVWIGPESPFEKLLAFGGIAGISLVFLSVLLDRIKALKTERYREVKKGSSQPREPLKANASQRPWAWSGETPFARNIGKGIAAVFRGIVGGEISEYTKLFAESREEALDRMLEEARSLGANAVVELRFSTSMVMSAAAKGAAKAMGGEDAMGKMKATKEGSGLASLAGNADLVKLLTDLGMDAGMIEKFASGLLDAVGGGSPGSDLLSPKTKLLRKASASCRAAHSTSDAMERAPPLSRRGPRTSEPVDDRIDHEARDSGTGTTQNSYTLPKRDTGGPVTGSACSRRASAGRR